jgi:hypothetical protein
MMLFGDYNSLDDGDGHTMAKLKVYHCLCIVDAKSLADFADASKGDMYGAFRTHVLGKQVDIPISS